MSLLRDVREKIPCFSSDTWNPKSSPVRLNASLSSLYVLDYSFRYSELGPVTAPPTVTLGGHTFTFKGGRWVLHNGPQGQSPKAGERSRIDRLKKRNRALLEENRALKLRMEVLMDMATDATAQLHELTARTESKRHGQRCPSPPQDKHVGFQGRPAKRKSKRS